MEPTGYCWPGAAGHFPYPRRASIARTYTDSYGDCAAPQAGPKNKLTGQYWGIAVRPLLHCRKKPQKKKIRKNVLKSSF